MVPSLPAVSMPCSTTSRARLPSAYSLSCSSLMISPSSSALLLGRLAVGEGRGVGGIAAGKMRALARREAEAGGEGVSLGMIRASTCCIAWPRMRQDSHAEIVATLDTVTVNPRRARYRSSASRIGRWPLRILRAATSGVNHAARSASGNSRIRPDRGGHSMANVLLLRLAGSNSPSTAHASTILAADWRNAPSAIASPSASRPSPRRTRAVPQQAGARPAL